MYFKAILEIPMTFKGLKVHFLSNFFIFYLALLKIDGFKLPFLKSDGYQCTCSTRSIGTPVYPSKLDSSQKC